MQRIRRVFTVGNIGRETQIQYPELSSVFKAAAIKHMLYYFAHRLGTGPAATTMHKIRCTAAWALADFIHRVDSGPRFMSLDERLREWEKTQC